MLDLIWEPDAEEQLDAVLEFIGERNERAAERMLVLIAEAIERIQRSPNIGRPGRIAGTRELIAHPNYIVIYQITDTAIEIVRFLNARQQYP